MQTILYDLINHPKVKKQDFSSNFIGVCFEIEQLSDTDSIVLKPPQTALTSTLSELSELIDMADESKKLIEKGEVIEWDEFIKKM